MPGETTQAYQADAGTTGVTVRNRDNTAENFASWPMEQKRATKGADPTAITVVDSVSQLNGAPYTNAARLFDIGHAPFAVLSVEFDTAADRTATLQPVFYDASNNVIGIGSTLQFATQKVGSTTLLDETTGHALGGTEMIDCKGACKIGFIVQAHGGGDLYVFGWPV